MSQIILQFDEDCAPDQGEPGTLVSLPHGFASLRLQFFGFPSCDDPRQTKRFAWQKPIANWIHGCLSYFRLYDQLGEDFLGLVKSEVQLICARTKRFRAQEQLFCSHLCASKKKAFVVSQFFSDVISFFVGCQTNLIERFRNCLQSSAHLCLPQLTRSHSFGSPLGGL